LTSIGKFLRDYKQFAFVVVSIIVGAALDLAGFDTASHAVLGGCAILLTFPLVWGMIDDLRHGTYGIDILAATAIVASVVLHEYWAAIIIVLMLTGGESLEDYAERRAKTELDALLKQKPGTAHVLRGRKVVDMKVEAVSANDKLILRPGEIVPVDAVIIEGTSSFDESSLTGESLPVDKKLGDELLSGSVNMDGLVTVRSLRPASESQFETIIKLVRAAASTESPFVRLTDRYAIPFTLISFMIAGTAWVLSGDPVRFLQVIVVATPCPLLLAAPIALISGMSRQAKNGIIVKNGSALERLALVRTVALDKTGTLTRGVPVIDRIETFGKAKKDDVLTYAAALEQQSNHILARAIVNGAKESGLKVPKVKHQNEVPGRGLSANVAGHRVAVGKLEFVRELGADMPNGAKFTAPKHTATYVSIGDSVAGVITFKDEIRPESEAMLAKLKKLGIRHTMMITGDNAGVANEIARSLGIEKVVSEALPVDKVLAIEQAEFKPLAFVGDGVNDAPVLTASDVGIALGARGSTAASESADVVILQDDVGKVARAIEIAKRTFAIARQAILIGIGLSIVLQLIFFTGRFKPVYGAILQEFVDVAVIFIALRAHGPFRKTAE
jgi:heavy metal translocating P-type ATPase